MNGADWQLQAWFSKYLCLKWSITLTFHDYLTFKKKKGSLISLYFVLGVKDKLLGSDIKL